jgi:hypothetical protein
MKTNKVSKLLTLNLISQILPSVLLTLFLIGSWHSIINLYIGITEGGVKLYEFKTTDRTYSYKASLTYLALLDEILNICILFTGIYFFNYILDQKIKIANNLIQDVINNQLSFEELIFLRSYFAVNPIHFEQQLKIVNARLELKVI